MSRTIPWETIKDWFAQHEQTLRDVGRFEGLRGVVNEVLRLAPDQPELAALREDLRIANEYCDSEQELMQSKLTAAEQRNAGLVELLTRTLAYYTESCFPEDLLIEVKIAFAALKPTESGASE